MNRTVTLARPGSCTASFDLLLGLPSTGRLEGVMTATQTGVGTFCLRATQTTGQPRPRQEG
jgi:hypothetical protein